MSAINDFINTVEPDIIILTELITKNRCSTNPECEEVSSYSNSSCFSELESEQVERIVNATGDNYTIRCNEGFQYSTIESYDGYTCIAIKNGIGITIT